MTTKPNMAALERLLTIEISPEELAKVLDDVAFDYADGLIRNCDEIVPGNIQADNIYFMRRLRDALWQASHPEGKPE